MMHIKKTNPRRQPLLLLLIILLILGCSIARGEGGQQAALQIQRDLEEEDYSPLQNHSDTPPPATTSKRHYTFAVVPKMLNNPFFGPVEEGCREKALQLTTVETGATVECLYIGPLDGNDQAQMVEDLLFGANATKIDGIAISVFNAEEMTEVIDKAVQKLQIPVITFDSDAIESKRSYYVGTNNSFFGMQLARQMETLMPNGGTYAIITANGPNLQERVDGIQRELNHKSNAHHPWQLLEAYNPGGRDMNKTFQKMQEWARMDETPSVIVSVLYYPMQSVVDEATGTSSSPWKEFVDEHRHRNIIMLCGDSLDMQLEFLQSGYVDGLVGQLPFDMGIKAIQTLWTLTFEPDAELGDPEDVEDGDDNDTTDIIGTNVISHVHIPLRLPPVQVDQNLVGDLKFLGFILYGIIAVTAIGCATWAFVRRNVRVVRVAQPRFLIMIAVGIVIMAACMVPLGMDDDGGTRADCSDSSIELGEHCTSICMSVPWLASMGFTITFSALYSKTRRVNKIFRSNTAFGRVKVTEQDVLIPFFVLLAINAAILTVWTILDPLIYTREADFSRDGWNRVISTYGVCKSNNQAYYLAPLAVVNIGVLVLANWQAYQARDIETGFAETRYVAICMASMLQALLSGIPVLFIVKGLPKAYYIVMVLLIFIISMVILVVIFGPKIVFTQQYMNMSTKEQKEIMTQMIKKSAKSTDTRSTKSSVVSFAVPPKSFGRMSTLTTVTNNTPGPWVTNSHTATNTTSTRNYKRAQSNDDTPVSVTEPAVSFASTASDDTGLVFYRKGSDRAIKDEMATKVDLDSTAHATNTTSNYQRNDSTASDDSGLVFYRKSYPPAMSDVKAATKVQFNLDPEEKPLGNNSDKRNASVRASLQNEVIAEGDESGEHREEVGAQLEPLEHAADSFAEEHSVEVGVPALPLEDLEHAADSFVEEHREEVGVTAPPLEDLEHVVDMQTWFDALEEDLEHAPDRQTWVDEP